MPVVNIPWCCTGRTRIIAEKLIYFRDVSGCERAH